MKRIPLRVALVVTLLYALSIPFTGVSYAATSAPKANQALAQMLHGSQNSPVASAASSNYCGPAVNSLPQTISYYNGDGTGMARAVERWVRSDPYYEIKPDQSFGSWLSTLKFRTAPRSGPGSALTSNTYCPGGNSVANYIGRYGVAGLGMLDICHSSTKTTKSKVQKGGVWYWKYTTTTTERCKHAFKGYCRNVVKSAVFKTVKIHIRFQRIKPAPKQEQVVTPCVCEKLPAINSPEQIVSAKQQCEQKSDKFVWLDERQQCFVIVGNCSIIVAGSNNTVTVNGDICSTKIEQPPCTQCTLPPTCQPGEVGTPPNCRVSTCQELGTCPLSGLSVIQMNDVQVGQRSDNYCATAQLLAGHTGTLTMSTTFGSWNSSTKPLTFRVTGIQTVCATIADGTVYTAPSEVPQGAQGIPPGYDRITVSLSDDVYLTSTSDFTTFRILPLEPNPA